VVSYDHTLGTDRDWVRFLIGDHPKDLTKAVLQDEEINALLSEEQNKYYAAAMAGDIVVARLGGAVSKQVGELGITYGDSPESAYRTYLTNLRYRGARKSCKTAAFKVI
jgi:hypothetical protein